MSPLSASRRNDPCELCHGLDFAVLATRDRRRKLLTTVVCRTCGLVSHESIPTDAELADYYRDEYRQDYNGEFSPSNYRVVREWQRGEELLNLLRSHLPDAGQVIEVGSGIGCTVKNFELAGFECSGIEPGEGFCSYSRKQLNANVFQAELADMPREPQYDAVLLVHVLEHFNRPRAALEHIRDMLRPGGRLYIEVPNFGLPHAAPGKQFHFAHIYNFTAETLAMLANASGFRLEQELADHGTDKNLRMLFQADDSVRWKLNTDSAHRSIDAAHGHTWLSYHGRWSYLTNRIGQLWRKLRERRTADERLRSILARCQQTTAIAKAA